ncbi:MAG: hypothetical protein D4R72_07100 [Nitrosopumilales archaeon]|nr:MAG: hypothetical protein D4R72_07100 [Nitrosopumilales archaeon]
MFPRIKNKKAISTVLTTMIILVASVVLATSVVIYGTSLFQTGAQSQGLATSGIKIWINSTASQGYAWGAAAVRNTGDKLISVDTISVRGTAVPFSNWYFTSDPLQVTSENIQAAFNYTAVDANNMMKNSTTTGVGTARMFAVSSCNAATSTHALIIQEVIPGTAINPTVCLAQASGPVSLKPGQAAIVYFKLPDGVLKTVDAGVASSVAIYASQVGAPATVTVANP